MKRLVVFTLAHLLLISLQAQTPTWDSTFRPNNYAVRIEQFRAYPNSEKDIIFLGNSITDYTDWNELLQMNTVKNRGISGDISFGILERLAEITEGKPAKLFILIGINDISRNIPDSIIIDNYKRIIQRVRQESPKTMIYFHTLLPVNNSYPSRNHFNKDEHIHYVNYELKKLASREKITVIDIYPQFLDDQKRLDKRYTYDGLHLNHSGYQKWAEILKPYLNN